MNVCMQESKVFPGHEVKVSTRALVRLRVGTVLVNGHAHEHYGLNALNIHLKEGDVIALPYGKSSFELWEEGGKGGDGLL